MTLLNNDGWLKILADPASNQEDWLAYSWWLRDVGDDLEGADTVQMCVERGLWPRISLKYPSFWCWWRDITLGRVNLPPLRHSLAVDVFDRLEGHLNLDPFSYAFYPDPVSACKALASVLTSELQEVK